MVVVELEPGIGRRTVVDVRGSSGMGDSELPPMEGRLSNSIVKSSGKFCSLPPSPWWPSGSK